MSASELAGRQGKQPDGSAKAREVNLCTLWSAEGRDVEGTPVRHEALISYSAAIESAANRHRLRSPEFRALGLCTSTGVVEAGCKVAHGARLKRADMHWTLAGANAIIALRCCKLSHRFADFWQVRARHRLRA